MAKKRKTRPSYQPEIVPEPEPAQIQEPEQPQPDSDPQLEAPNQEQEQEVEEEVVEEVEEEEEEEEDVEESDPEEEETPENMETDVTKSDEKGNPSNDAVSAGKANGEEKKGEEIEDLDDEPLENVLEPFSNKQLKVIIQEAVTKHPDFMENVRNWADKDPAHRKIFVHGLGWDTTTETLINVFGKYGEIEDCKAVTDKVSGKSKGYAFILFKHRSGAKKALKEPQKKIGNRTTSCQLASAGPVPAPPPNAPPVSEYTQRKIFVSNVSADLEPKKLLEFFSQYGEIEEGPLGLDKQSGKPKGFCLFVYRTVEGAKKALEEPHKGFEGHMLNCQRAIDGPKQSKNYSQPQQQPHYHQHQQQQYYQHTAKKGKYSGGGGGGGGGGGSGASSAGHLMAPAAGQGAVGFNPAVAPALGQALTALLSSQGAGLGIGNLLGGLPMNPHGVPPVVNNPGYGTQGAAGSYGGHPGMQGGYQNPPMGQGGARPQGGAPWRGH